MERLSGMTTARKRTELFLCKLVYVRFLSTSQDTFLKSSPVSMQIGLFSGPSVLTFRAILCGGGGCDLKWEVGQ